MSFVIAFSRLKLYRIFGNAKTNYSLIYLVFRALDWIENETYWSDSRNFFELFKTIAWFIPVKM